jgi:NSS family neurotransmitter:Na+ symporter
MKPKYDHPLREKFVSQFGLVMSAVGSAVGLGNIWRFSYILGINGGGAFLLVYVLCVFFIGLPVLISELAIGRSSGFSTVSAFQKLAPSSFWWISGAMAVLAATLIACYYPVVAGWALGYVFESLLNWEAMIADTGAAFTEFSSGWKAFVFGGISLVLTAAILLKGISAGIERWSKVLMPLLALFLIILVFRSVTLPGSSRGVRFLFYPDFSKLTVKGFLDALGHSFYSLSLGMGIMVTYASYMKKDANLVEATVFIVTLDTFVALLAGLAIFPAVFAMGFNPGEGAGLAFVTLPAAFGKMPLGWLFSAFFFLLIFIAALTSLISIFQVPLAFLEDRFGFGKKKSLVLITAFTALFGTPSVLAFGPLSGFSIFGMDYFTLLDRLANNVLLPVSSLLGILFIVFKFGITASVEEFLRGSKHQNHFLASLYALSIRFLAPIAIIVILIRAILAA